MSVTLMFPDGAIELDVEELNFNRTLAIYRSTIAALREARAAEAVSEAVAALATTFNVDIQGLFRPREADEPSDGLSPIGRFLASQDWHSLIDGARRLIAEHLTPLLATLPDVVEALCIAATQILDNKANCKKISRVLGPDVDLKPVKKLGFYVGSQAPEVIAQVIRPNEAIDVVTQFLALQDLGETLGKLLPLARIAPLAPSEKVAGDSAPAI